MKGKKREKREKKTEKEKTRNQGKKNKKRGGGAQRPKATGKQETPETTGRRGGKKKGGEGAKTPRPRAPQAGKHAKQETTGRTEGGEGKRKKKGGGTRRQSPRHPGTENTQSRTQRGRNEGEKGKRNKKNKKNPTTTTNGATPAWRGPNKQRANQERPKERCGAPKRAMEGPPTRPGQAGHAHAHTRGTWAWRPSTRNGRCRRPHETAPVHRPSPPSQDGRYGKPNASVTGSTHAKPPQRTQPKTEAGGTRQGQRHRGAPNV